jgi:hypothetical protein
MRASESSWAMWPRRAMFVTGIIRSITHDGLDLGLEAHAEHPIGLVQNYKSDGREIGLNRLLIRPGVAMTQSMTRSNGAICGYLGVPQQRQLMKSGILIYYLDKFKLSRSLHTQRALGQTASQSNHRRGLLSF